MKEFFTFLSFWLNFNYFYVTLTVNKAIQCPLNLLWRLSSVNVENEVITVAFSSSSAISVETSPLLSFLN